MRKNTIMLDDTFVQGYHKIVKTISSCNNEAHLNAAYKMISNFTSMMLHKYSANNVGIYDAIEKQFEIEKRIGELDKMLKQKCAELLNSTAGDELRSILEPLDNLLDTWKGLNNPLNKNNKKYIKSEFAKIMESMYKVQCDLINFCNYIDEYPFDKDKFNQIIKQLLNNTINENTVGQEKNM